MILFLRLEQFSNRHAVSHPQLRTLWGPCVYLQSSLFMQLSLLCYSVLWILAPLPLLLSKLLSPQLKESTELHLSSLSLPWSLKATPTQKTGATIGFSAFIFQFLLLNVQYMKNPFFPCSSDWKFISICIQLGISLLVQWLRLCTSTARSMDLIPDWGMKIPCAVWCSQKIIKKKCITYSASPTLFLPCSLSSSMCQDNPVNLLFSYCILSVLEFTFSPFL